MENAPNDTDSDSDGEKDSDRAKRRASNSSDRAVAVPREGVRLQPLKPELEQEREKASLWRRLIGGEPGTAEPSKPAERSETAEPTDSEAAPSRESAEQAEAADDLPLTALSPEEETLVVHRLLEADGVAGEETQPSDEEPAVAEAIDRFHDDILTGNKTLPEAFDGTLAWLDGEEPPDGVPPAEQPEIQLPAEDVSAEPAPAEVAVAAAYLDGPGDPGGPPSGDHRYNVSPNWPPQHIAFPAAELSPAAPVAETAVGYDKSDVVGAALIGGLVGYLVGRRRGRIKTEKRLIPVQKKLEKQVKGLQEDIKKKESVIREKATESARERRQLAANVRGPAEKARERELLRAVAAGNLAAGQKAGRPQERFRIDRTGQPAALQPEQQHIGQMLITAAEALPPAAAELAESARTYVAGAAQQEAPRGRREQPVSTSAEWASKPAEKARAEQAPLLPIDKHVETLSQKDLLELSSKIIVDGTTLKQAYESHQVGERALRRMVSEHLRGGDVREALKHEVVEHEIDFERDPQLRDQGQPEPKRAAQGGGGSGLQALIRQADAGIGGDDADRRAVLATRAEHQAKQRAKQDKRHSQKHLVDAAMLAVIASLIGLIILLIIGHG